MYPSTVCTVNAVRMTITSVRNKGKMVIGQMPGQYHLGSDIFSFARTYFGEVHMCHSRCVSTNSECISRHSQYTCATVDVYQQIVNT